MKVKVTFWFIQFSKSELISSFHSTHVPLFNAIFFIFVFLSLTRRQRTSCGNSNGNDNGNCKGNYQWLHAVREWVIRLGGTLGRVGGGDNSNRRARAIERIFQTPPYARLPDYFQHIRLFFILKIVFLWVSDISKLRQKESRRSGKY